MLNTTIAQPINLGCFSLALLFSATTFAGDPKVEPTKAEIQLTELLDRVWDYELESSPLLATNVGDPRGQDRLANDSLSAIKERAQQRERFLDELKQIAVGSLNSGKRIDHELLRRRLEDQLSDFRFQTHLMPINNRSGFHIRFPELPRVMNPRSKQDFANYVARLKDFDRYVDEQITLLRGGMEAGLVQPAIIMRDSLSQVQAQIVDDLSKSLFISNIAEEAIAALDPDSWKQIESEIRDAIQSSVIPAYQRFAVFLETEYLPACRGPVGAAALPMGREFYLNRIRRFTTLDISPEELHQTGIRENGRIRLELEVI